MIGEGRTDVMEGGGVIEWGLFFGVRRRGTGEGGLIEGIRGFMLCMLKGKSAYECC